MVKITVEANCGNSPKAELIRDMNIAFAEGDSKFILDNMADDIHWELVGVEIIEGKIAAIDALDKMLDDSTEELVIQNVITHGDVGSINGTMKFDEGMEFGFCDVYTFTSHAKDAKIKSITSYIVEIK